MLSFVLRLCLRGHTTIRYFLPVPTVFCVSLRKSVATTSYLHNFRSRRFALWEKRKETANISDYLRLSLVCHFKFVTAAQLSTMVEGLGGEWDTPSVQQSLATNDFANSWHSELGAGNEKSLGVTAWKESHAHSTPTMSHIAATSVLSIANLRVALRA